MADESLEFDVVIVGAGPAGLSAAIRLGQINQQREQPLSVCVLEKGAEVGAHVLSGAVFESRALDELMPQWQSLNAPITTAVTDDAFYWMSKNKAWRLPTPGPMHNAGNYVISLGLLCRWLASEAEQLGVEIFPGFPASQFLLNEHGVVCGVQTADVGIDKAGNKTDRFQAGVKIFAQQTLIAEGCHGSLSKQIIQHFKLRKADNFQTYGIGIKELWKVDSKQYKPGHVSHSIGWPLDHKTYGGSFIYHLDNNIVSLGYIVGLDYENPYLDPFQELQRFKTHPTVRPLLDGGERIAYGSRALIEGGLQSLPKLTFPGGLLLGDSAGLLNVGKIKGTHCAMKSGMIAAETIADASALNTELTSYQQSIESSWIWDELYRIRNLRPGFRWGLLPGMINAAVDYYLFRGRAPWTLKHKQPDHLTLKPANQSKPIDYPQPDGKLTFDKLSSVYLSNTNHNEDQPCHLVLADKNIAIDVNWQIYHSPETRYCPANVYEIIEDAGKATLQINASNCVHCKTCDIKDPRQNINWIPPEGGDGPNYSEM